MFMTANSLKRANTTDDSDAVALQVSLILTLTENIFTHSLAL